LNLGNPKLGVGKVDSELVTLPAREAANVSEEAAANFKTDAPVFLLSAARTMLQELEKPPEESKLLTDLFLKLSHVSDAKRNCDIVSRDTDNKTTQDDIYALEIRHNTQKQDTMQNHLCGTGERITKLKENSLKMVSMFIPPEAPKLSFSSDAVGMYY